MCLLDLSCLQYSTTASVTRAFIQCAQENPLEYSMMLMPENTEEVQISDKVNSTLQFIYDLNALSQYCAKPISIIFL